MCAYVLWTNNERYNLVSEVGYLFCAKNRQTLEGWATHARSPTMVRSRRSFISHFEDCAELVGWSARSCVLFPTSSLHGKACQYYISLDKHERWDYCTLANPMKQRCNTLWLWISCTRLSRQIWSAAVLTTIVPATTRPPLWLTSMTTDH